MTLKQIQYFVTVAEELHFGRAADRLRVAQPPISRQIRQLEVELKVKLFSRTKRRVALTEPGKAFLEAARETLRQAENAALVAKRTGRGEAGQLAISTSSSLPFTGMLPTLIRSFRGSYPRVELLFKEGRTQEQLERIHLGQSDVGFVRLPIRPIPSSLVVEVILREAICIAMNEDHHLAARRKVELKDLGKEPFIMYPYQVGGLHDWAIRTFRDAGFEPRIVQEASTVPLATTLAAAGLGLALVPECTQNIKIPGVVYKTIDSRSAKTEVALVYRAFDRSALVRNFVRSCLKLAQR